MRKIVLYVLVVIAFGVSGCGRRKVESSNIALGHSHAQMLLDNSFKYLNPANGLVDVASGYPVEGWNQDPEQGLYLRGFTQLTAIGEWVELLANIASGQADNPYISRGQAFDDLAKVIKNLMEDQNDSSVSAKGLLVNFLGFDNGARVGPLTSRVLRESFLKTFGNDKGASIWNALEQKEWISYEKDGSEAQVKRSATYGNKYFDGCLEPYADTETSEKIMKLLDARVVTIIFGDNVNLTASIAKGIGALLDPLIKDDPKAISLRNSMEVFIENQREGYTYLYDKKAGNFVFGWNASEDRYTGWELDDGTWVVGRMNYFINEFRGGWMFVVLKYGLPDAALSSGSFKLKPYQMQDGRTLYVPAAWDGSSFQMIGLTLFMQEMDMSGWSSLLKNAVKVELDYSEKNKLPGFLSESYSGKGSEYTGSVAIPQIAVTEESRTVDAPSLYTLGGAYQIEPELVETFLENNWSVISSLFTEHGPWEGYNTTTHLPIKFQTTAHTVSLVLGLIGQGHDNMKRYLEQTDLQDDLLDLYQEGEVVDFLADTFKIFGWCNADGILDVMRSEDQCTVRGRNISNANLAIVPKTETTVNISGKTLQLSYSSKNAISGVVLSLNSKSLTEIQVMKNELFVDFEATGEIVKKVEIPLPLIPALSCIDELLFTFGKGESAQTIDLTITGLKVD